MPALNRAKEQGKRATCLNNLKQLTLAWILYSDDNDDKLVCGDTEEYTDMYTNPNAPFNKSHYNEKAWVLRDWDTSMPIDQKRRAILNGALYSYCEDIKLFRCPTVRTQEQIMRTYSCVDSMNCRHWDSMGVVMLKRRHEIPNAPYRFVYLDDGGASFAHIGGWTCYVQEERWWDPPPIRHGDGTNFSYADGHADYVKWKDPRTIEFGKLVPPRARSDPQPGNEDIRLAAIGMWGSAAKR